MTVSVDIADPRWEKIGDMNGLAQTAVSAAMLDQRDVSVLFTSDADIQVMNKTWRKQDKPTNVLSFPAAPLPAVPDHDLPLGDIALAYETVMREAEEADKPVAHHVTHLLVHGTLHLLGYDHETDVDADEMEAKERQILARMGIADPYAA
jgi:probable rRNA maturation factor